MYTINNSNANISIKKVQEMKKKYSLDNISAIDLALNKQSIIFLRGDLGAWKTTFSKHIFQNILRIQDEIRSPTYTYYKKYGKHYHFDLYRLEDYEEFFAIWWEDIFDNNEGIIVVEWPDIIQKYYKPDIIISFERTQKKGEREIEIIYA